MKENFEVRRVAKAANVPQWKIASKIGISEATLTRWLRVPLTAEKEKRILQAISVLAQEVIE